MSTTVKTDNGFSLLFSIGDLLSEGLVIFDLKKQRVLYANSAATAMTGVEQDSGLEKIMLLWKQIRLDDRIYLRSQFEDILQEPSSRSAEFSLIKQDKKKIHLHVLACALHERSLVAVFLRDITRMKEHEDYLVEFGIRKNTLLDTLTHNLSGSLNLTNHLARQAEKHTTSADTELRSVLELITESTTSNLKVIDDFVVYEYAKAPHIHVKASRIDLVAKIGFIHEQLLNSYPERTFQLLSNKQELHVTTDEVKLLQVMNNFISNALKFSPPESLITMRIQAEEKEVIISVEDNGIGIPDSLKPLIFIRQANTGRPGLKGEPSHGQGLSICKNLVELMQGKIWFESAENAGSVFFISLPYTLNTDQSQGSTLGL